MAEPFSVKWHYPPVDEHTGVMQFARNGGEGAKLGDRLDVVRAEVFKVPSKKFAASLARGGKCSHVAADTPLGQPEEYKPQPPAQAAPQQQPPAREEQE